VRLELTTLVCLFIVGCATPRGVELHERPRESKFGPWSKSEQAPVVASGTHPGAGPTRGAPNDGLIDFVFSGYARYLTKVDGPRCEHRPTCSKYAFLAVKEHGYVVGSFLTIDRLLRSGRSSALRTMPLYKIEDGTRYYYDPVRNNDFWFEDGARDAE